MSLAPYFGRYASLPLFIVYALAPNDKGGADKLPIDPLSGRNVDSQDVANRMPLAEAEFIVKSGVGHGVGFVITDNSPLMFLDLDHCREGEHWQPHVSSFLARFPGAYIEVSQSNEGLHVLATQNAADVEHGTRNKEFRMELYSQLRFCALTGKSASGSVETDCTAAFKQLAAEYFPPRPDDERAAEWTDTPVPQWAGPDDDAELVRRARRSASASAVFGGKAAFSDLWDKNVDVLARLWPASGADVFNRSSADLALANHLAFWTGNNCERMAHLMSLSSLAREKWNRTSYFQGTILRACSSQREWYNDGSARAPEPPAVVALALPGAAPVVVPVPAPDAPDAPPPPEAPILIGPGELPPPGAYVTLTMQQQLFHQMTYIRDIHAVQLASGGTLDKQRFDAVYGGRQYGMTPDGQRPSKSAWDAFVSSELTDFPKAHGQFFDPRRNPHAIITREGRRLVNSWMPIDIPRVKGDPSPFLDHLQIMLPRGNDAQLLLYYLAAIIQNPGVKFMYCPLIQGVEGNGKSLISVLMERCIGECYTHWPKASDLGNKFNALFYGKILICVNDVFTIEGRGQLWETIKPIITESKLEIEFKGVDKVMREICCNFILNTNHKDGLKKTANDRRIMPLFCAQQEKADLARDGLTQGYFNKYRAWVMGPGGAIMAEYLATMEIPDELNPATQAIVAPETSSTGEAIEASHGAAEQEILEAIAQQQEGFKGGWISSTALDHLLQRVGKERAVPRRARRAILSSFGYVPHAALSPSDGRLTSKLPDGTQPVMYIRKEHSWNVAYVTNAQLVAAYLEHQKQT